MLWNPKTTFQFLFTIYLVHLICLTPVFAKETKILTSPITDEVGILSSSQVTHLQSVISDIESKTGAQVFLYIIESLEGENLESYSLQVAEQSKIGQKGKDNGVLVLLSVGDRKVRIEVGYGLEETLTDVLCNRIIRNIMIPEFKKGDIPNGILLGYDAITLILFGDADSNPNLQTNYPDGIGTAFSNDNTVTNIGISIVVLVVSGIGYFLLTDGKKFKRKIWLDVLYGGVVVAGLVYFLPDAVFYFFCFGIVALNLYLLYGLSEWFSYPLAIFSLLFWIPFLHFSFHAEWIVLFWVIGIIGGILLFIKLALDEVLIQSYKNFAKQLGFSASGLFFHSIAVLSFWYSIQSILNQERLFTILYYQGLILFTIYGFSISVFQKHALRYGIAFLLWLSVVAGIFFFWPTGGNTSPQIDFSNVFNSFQWFFCLVLGYVLAKSIQVKSWKTRVLKYGFISLVWTFGFSIEGILGFKDSFNFSISTFIFSYFVLLLLHFFYTIWEDSDGSSYSSYSSSSSSSSSYTSSSSSYRSSSSSSSSGGGGGSFGGGGSSGSW
ncbi:TPM domain-containing protein [Leptospira levettii]|uniref:TPM domain-containing protein n=1 Tax=Leptospira levettii TaxID=2023178 RepID=UPI0010823A46|nr:TPM domain-containing protein [Leptospira levettii]TGM28960.1 TPM domain-containing protein [Leptospira levettii]TGM83696.1 TPM domain-containing protein [Leptospira levettii]